MSEIVKIETRGSAHVLAPTSDAVEEQEVSISTWVGIHKYFIISWALTSDYLYIMQGGEMTSDKCTTHSLLLMCI